ncbi:glutathione S-transferase family protein [Sphingomonas sp. CGMCC 1.13654]|uniref:Glutathione S-transferase family protein n=1 Tax=Sphingomonas chungangi TaxID=2683589 RepID=A0A838LE13_9SPHN|nr:glutathione S-transferase family protein [Sphingomonas chungangi]MBA2936376.1 glutathione S-transferase family protein [Sphingomonas chungangi]MVW55761.1 glutathione S-transferase family protein [Sphingomonas chungangi]
MEKLTLHEYAPSGNCYKIRLVASHLGVTLGRRHYDILNGETRTPDFLRTVNGNGRIPVLQIGDRYLPESGAACFYLAEGSSLIPDDRFDRADMLRWMNFEQYNHEPNVATLRFWLAFIGEGGLSDFQKAQLPGKRAAGDAALDLMERHLADRAFFVADRFTLADVALFAYTHVADEGGFDLASRPAIRTWIDRISALPGHIPIDA